MKIILDRIIGGTSEIVRNGFDGILEQIPIERWTNVLRHLVHDRRLRDRLKAAVENPEGH